MSSDLFVRKLMERQQELGLSTRRFAREKLGINPGSWSRVRRGEHGPSKKLIDNALNSFPELGYYYVRVLS